LLIIVFEENSINTKELKDIEVLEMKLIKSRSFFVIECVIKFEVWFKGEKMLGNQGILEQELGLSMKREGMEMFLG